MRKSTRSAPASTGWLFSILLTPFLVVSLFLVYRVATGLALFTLGNRAPVTIVNARERSRSAGEPSYEVRFTFRAGGREIAVQRSVPDYNDRDDYEALYFPFRPQWSPLLRAQGQPYLASQGFWAILCGFWNLLVLPFAWFLWVIPLRQRRLVRYGMPAVGRVVELPVSEDADPTEIRVTYEFAPEGCTNVFSGVAITPKADQAHLRPGDALTVLYDPRRPSSHVAYRYCGYEVDA